MKQNPCQAFFLVFGGIFWLVLFNFFFFFPAENESRRISDSFQDNKGNLMRVMVAVGV